MLRAVFIASVLAGCYPPSNNPGYFTYYVPVYAPPPPFPFAQLGPDSMYQARAPMPDVQFQTPSLTVRALAGKISAAASQGDCAGAIAAGNELEKIDADSHHAILAVDERYAVCVRGF